MELNQQLLPGQNLRLTNMRFWCQQVLPAVYDDSLSYYELLCKVVNKLNELIEQVGSTVDGVKELTTFVNNLQDQLNAFREHGFDDYYKAQVQTWIDSHLDVIYNYTIKQVYFGLNQDGYFVAYIPDSWDDIIFDTGFNYSDATYGRLILRWDTDNETETVDQTPEIVR
jgi:hypothetical protein